MERKKNVGEKEGRGCGPRGSVETAVVDDRPDVIGV